MWARKGMRQCLELACDCVAGSFWQLSDGLGFLVLGWLRSDPVCRVKGLRSQCYGDGGREGCLRLLCSQSTFIGLS